MSKRLLFEIGAGLVLVALLCWVAWDQYHRALDNAKAEEFAKMQDLADKKVDAALAKRDSEYKEKEKAMDDKISALTKMTPQQIVIKAPEYIPALQGKPPITIVGPDTQAARIGDAIVPQESIKPLAAEILNGQKCTGIELPKCTADLADWRQKYELKSTESAYWEKTAKGGSWLKRLGKNTLKVGAGAALGIVIDQALIKRGR